MINFDEDSVDLLVDTLGDKVHCPRCNTTKVPTGLVNVTYQPVDTDRHSYNYYAPPVNYVPLAIFVCHKCGHIDTFSIGVLGIGYELRRNTDASYFIKLIDLRPKPHLVLLKK